MRPGQRWYSDNEPELGLGIVQNVEPRQVHLFFPAIDEERIYRLQDAPLSRIRFQPNESIFHTNGMKLHVTAVEENDGLLTYITHDDQGHSLEVPESELDSRLQLSRPQDRLLGGHLDPPRLYRLRQTIRAMQNELLPGPARGLHGCRVDLIPHQLYIAHEVAGRITPRVLLADEVGLGKTIEAGLVIHKQLLDERIARVLILVPESLQHQWLVEMLRRFNLRFSLLDEARCASLATGEDNPFDSEQLVLCSQEMFLQNTERQQQALASRWDLLVVDEAHHLEWTPQEVSPQYRFVEQLAETIPAVLLLTATPEQLGAAGHFARLRLLDPHRFYDLDEFLEEEDCYQPVIQAVNELLDNRPLSSESREALQLALGKHPTFADLLHRADIANDETGSQHERERARQQLTHLLVDRHGTGRILFRNTRAAIRGFPERHLHASSLPRPEAYATRSPNQTLDSGINQLIPESAWERASDNPAGWLEIDPRVDWVVRTLREHRGEKALLICARAGTAQRLESYLRERIGLRSAVFHEGLTIVERDRAAAYFADPDQGAQVLVCSEIGSEGRNFQFAQHLLLFDLPAHPDLLEQRIGRLDRIGQKHAVQIHVAYINGTPQQNLFRLYHEALQAFEQACATGASLFERFRQPIDKLLADTIEHGEMETLLQEMADEHRRLARQLELGRDRLLELNSYRADEADYLLEAIQRLENDPRLLEFLDDACSHFGVDLEVHGEDSHVMHPGNHMLVEHFPGLPEDGLTLTRSRSTALAREDWQFLSWEHPMIRGIINLVMEDHHGNAALGIVRHNAYPAGTLLLECHFILLGVAPSRLQLSRFLPPTTLRRVIDANGGDCTTQFPAENLALIPTELDKTTRGKIIRARQDELRQMLQQAEEQVSADAEKVLESATQRMRTVMDNTIARMQHLAQINPNVRDSEIEALQAQRNALENHIRQVQPALDSVRLLITG